MFNFIEKAISKRFTFFMVVSLFFLYFAFMVIFPIFHNHCIGVGFSCRSNFLFETWHQWQTINAAVIALFATLLVAYIATLNERTNRDKKREASRAFLSLAFAEISHYLEEVVCQLEKIYDLDSETEKLEYNSPKVPSAALNRIESFIGASNLDDKCLVDHLIIVVNAIQIHNSRLNGYLKSMSNSQQQFAFPSHINQSIRLYVLISGIYMFSRNEVQDYKVQHLDRNKLEFNGCGCYMTSQELDKYSKEKITLSLFCSD